MDEITASGFWFTGRTGTAELILNTDGTEIKADRYGTHLETVSDSVAVTITATADETALLQAMRRTVFDRFDKTTHA